MSFSVGEVVIEMSANVARLKADMDDAKKAVGGAMKEIEQYAGYAKTALVALGGVASVNALLGIVSSGIEAKSRLYDLSLQTGITVEALSALGKVAKYSNTSLDDVAAGSNKLTKALFTSGEESKGAAQGLKALGINFDKFKKLSADQEMLAVAKALDQFQDGSGKSAVAMLLFGKTGAELLPFLKELAEKNELVGKQTTASAKEAKLYEDNLITLRGAGEEWRRQLVNDILPALVSVTSELVEGRKAYGGYWGAIKDIGLNVNPFKSLDENIGGTIAEFRRLDDEADKIKARQAGGGFLAGLFAKSDAEDLENLRADQKVLDQRLVYLRERQKATENAGRGSGNPGDRPKLADASDGDSKKAQKEQKDEYQSIIASINEKVVAQELELQQQQRLTAGQEDALKIMERIRAGLTGTTADENALIGARLTKQLIDEQAILTQRENEKWIKQAQEDNARALEMMQDYTNGLLDQAKVQQDQLKQYGLTKGELEQLTSQRLRDAAAAMVQKAAWAAADGFLSQQSELYFTQAQALRDNADALDQLNANRTQDANDPLRGSDRAIKEYLADVKRAGDSTYGAVGNSIRGLEDLTTSLLTTGKGNIKQWVDSVISEITRISVVRPLLASIFGAGGNSGFLAGLIGTASAYITGSYDANYSHEGLNYGGPRASGGPVSAGQDYLVGEKGPEILRMGRQGGVVIPNASTSAAAPQRPSITNHVTVNVASGTSRDTAMQTAAAIAAQLSRAQARNS